jgi:hypothetical protein
MTLVFEKVNLDRIMELSGEIDFPKGKTLVLYGSNQQGKTNVINAMRYAFLKETKSRRKRRAEYDEWAIPTRKEMVFDGAASIEILFEHNKVPYTLKRTISDKARREETVLYSPKKPSQKLDANEFLRNRLKVSLLDALFAPEIAGGFKRLYSGDIDHSISELFKDITTIRAITTKFIRRLQNMKTAAIAEIAATERRYQAFCQNLFKVAPELSNITELVTLQRFENRRILKKLDALHDKLQTMVKKLEEETLLKDVHDAEAKAKERDKLLLDIGKRDRIKRSFVELKVTKSDHSRMRRWLRLARRVSSINDKVPTPPVIRDNRIKVFLANSFTSINKSKKEHFDMSRLAAQNTVRPELVDEKIKELSAILTILLKKRKLEKVTAAGVTEIANKAYTVLPVAVLAKRPTLAEISNEPIPKGSLKERKQYQLMLKAKIDSLRRIKSLRDSSKQGFDSFKHDVDEASTLAEDLGKAVERIKSRIQKWSTDLASGASSFLGKKVNAKTLSSPRAADSFGLTLMKLISEREKRYLSRLNSNVKSLGVKFEELSRAQVRKVGKTIRQQRKELPALNKARALLESNKGEWQRQEEVYSDYIQIQEVAEKCFDQDKLKQLIASTYNEIIRAMVERKLIKATVEMPTGTLRGAVKYKERDITHPAGSEKAFFTLAILTVLAHYFQTPVLIDEVANNLDSKNLKAFFELIREFKERWGVQYVLSVKETKDFELDGWVKEMSDHLTIYEVNEKAIRPML